MSDKISIITSASLNNESNMNYNNYCKNQENRDSNFKEILNNMINRNNIKPVSKGVNVDNKFILKLKDYKRKF